MAMSWPGRIGPGPTGSWWGGGASAGAIGADVHDGLVESSACCFRSGSRAGVRELLFDDTRSAPRSDVLGWAAGSVNVRSSWRYVNLHSLSDRK